MHEHATMGKSVKVKNVKKVDKKTRKKRIEKKNPVVVLKPLPPAIVEFYLSQMYGSNWSHYKGGYYFRNKQPYSSDGICCDNRSGRCAQGGNPRYNAPYYGQQQPYFSEQWDRNQFVNNGNNYYQPYRQYQQSYQDYDRFQQESRRNECYSESRYPRHGEYSYSQYRSRRGRGKKSHTTLPYQKPTAGKKLQSPVRERSSSCDTYEVLSEATCSDDENDPTASKVSSRRSSVNSERVASSTNSACTSPLHLSEESCDSCDIKSEKSDQESLTQNAQKSIASDNNLVTKVTPDEDCDIDSQKSGLVLSTQKPITSADHRLLEVTPDEDSISSDQELLLQKPRTSDDPTLPKTTPDIDVSTTKDVEGFNISSVGTVSNDAVSTENLRSQRLASPDQMPDFKGSALKELPPNATDTTVVHHEENTANCDEVDDSGCEWDNSDVETLPYESESETVDLALGEKRNSDCESEVLATNEQQEPENAESPRENASLDIHIPCASPRWKLIKFFCDSGGKQENEIKNRPLSDSQPVSQYDNGSPMLNQAEKETLEGMNCNTLDPRKCDVNDQKESSRNESIPENLPSLSASPLCLESEAFTTDSEQIKSVHSLDKTDVSSQKEKNCDSEHEEQITKQFSNNVTLPSDSATVHNSGIHIDKTASSTVSCKNVSCSGIDITKNNTSQDRLLKNKAHPVKVSSAPAGDVLGSIISNMNTVRYSLPVSIQNFSLTPKEPTRFVNTERSSKSLMMKGSSVISKSPMKSPPVFKSPTTSPSRTIEPPSPVTENDKTYSRLITYEKWKESEHSKKRKHEKGANDRSIKIQKRQDENNASKEGTATRNEPHSEEAAKLNSKVPQQKAPLEITRGSHEERKANEKHKCITNLHIKEVEKECELKLPTEVGSSKKNDIFRRNSKFMEDYRKKSKVKKVHERIGKEVNHNSKSLKNSALENTTKKSKCIANEYKCIVCKTFFRQTNNEETCIRCLKRNKNKKPMDNVALNRNDKKGTLENKILADQTSMKNKTGKTKQSTGEGKLISNNVKSSVNDLKQTSVANKDKMNMPKIEDKTSNSFEQGMPTKSQNKKPQHKRRHSVENETVAAKMKSPLVEPKTIIQMNEPKDKHRHNSNSESASSVSNESKKAEQHSGDIRFSKQEVVNGLLKLTFSDDDMLPYSLNTQKRSLENSDSEESLPDVLRTSSRRNTRVTNVVPTVEAAAMNTNAGLTNYQQQPAAKPDQVSQADVNALLTIKTLTYTWNPISDDRHALTYASGRIQTLANASSIEDSKTTHLNAITTNSPQKSVRTIAPKPAQACVIPNISLISNPETVMSTIPSTHTKHQNNTESTNSNVIVATAPLDSSTMFISSQQGPVVTVVQTLPGGDRTASVSNPVRSMPLYQNGSFLEPSSVCVSPSNIPQDSSAGVQIKIQETFSYKDIENIPSPYRKLIRQNESNENEIIDITSDDENSISLGERKIEKPFPKTKEETEVTPQLLCHKDDNFNKEDILSKLQTDHGFIKFLEQLKMNDTLEKCYIKIPKVTEDTNSLLVLYHAYMMGTLTSLPPEKIFKCIYKLLGHGKKPEEIYTEQKKELKKETITKAVGKDEKSLPSKTAETVTKADSKDEKSLPSKTAETVTKGNSKDEKSLPSKTADTSSLSRESNGPRIDTKKQNSLLATDILVSSRTISVPQSGHQSQVVPPSVSATSNTQGSLLANMLTDSVASHTPSPQLSNINASNEAVMPLVNGENIDCRYRTAVHNPAVILQSKQLPRDIEVTALPSKPVDSQQNPLQASASISLPTDRNSAPPNQAYSGSNVPFSVSHSSAVNRSHSADYQSPIVSCIPVIGSSPRISSVPVNQSYANIARTSLPSSFSAPVKNVYALGHSNVNQNVTTTNTLVDTQSVVKNDNAPQFAYTPNSSLSLSRPSSVFPTIKNVYALGHSNVNQTVTTTNTLTDTQSVVKNGNVTQFARALSVSITEAMNTPAAATNSVQSRTPVVQPTSTYSSVAAVSTSNEINHLNTMVTNLPQPTLQYGPVQSSPMYNTSSFAPSYTGNDAYAQVPSGNVQPRPNYYQNLPSLPLGNAGVTSTRVTMVPTTIANSLLYQQQPASTLQRQNQVPQSAVPRFYSPAGQTVITAGTYYPSYYPHQQQMNTGMLPPLPTVPSVQSYPRRTIGPPNVCVTNFPRATRPLLTTPASRFPSWHTPQQLLCSHCGKNASIACRGNCNKKFFCNVTCRDMHWNNGHCYECI